MVNMVARSQDYLPGLTGQIVILVTRPQGKWTNTSHGYWLYQVLWLLGVIGSIVIRSTRSEGSWDNQVPRFVGLTGPKVTGFNLSYGNSVYQFP